MDIVFDLDDVICDLCTPFHEALTHYTGKDIPINEWHDFNLAGVYGIDKQEVFDVLEGYNVFEQAIPHKGAIQAMVNVHKLGFNTHIVTSRKRIDPTGEMTSAWLEKYGVTYSELHITYEANGKVYVVKSISPILMIDDHIDNIKACSPYAFKLVIINRPWNLSFDESPLGNVIRRDSLSEVLAIL